MRSSQPSHSRSSQDRHTQKVTVVSRSSRDKRKAAAERKRKQRERLREDPEKYAMMKKKEKERSRKRREEKRFLVLMTWVNVERENKELNGESVTINTQKINFSNNELRTLLMNNLH
ncbi:hypothetical protein J6590_054273 [Homalodisca vitripennis]|nr:hypothetical protein J6590_054273 [Homalodisca vitripennis]